MSEIFHDSEVPAHGQQVFTACAFIHRIVDNEFQVFLPKRAMTKKFLPGKYELPGGHIDFGESMEEGLERELGEEFGVRVKLGDPFAVFTYINDIKGSHSIEVVYFAQLIDAPEKVTINPEDHESFGWFTEDEAVKINNDGTDAEVAVIKKGFAILRGEGLKI